nr:hypothetical protein Itr_chr02CG07000 [Ipomoea trifida]
MGASGRGPGVKNINATFATSLDVFAADDAANRSSSSSVMLCDSKDFFFSSSFVLAFNGGGGLCGDDNDDDGVETEKMEAGTVKGNDEKLLRRYEVEMIPTDKPIMKRRKLCTNMERDLDAIVN